MPLVNNPNIAAQQTLLAAVSATGAGTGVRWTGGRGTFAAVAAVWAGTCKLQWSPDNQTTWLDVDRTGDTYTTLTANGAGNFDLPECWIRANHITSAPTTLSAYVLRSTP